MNADLDRRRIRRPLSMDEFHRLVAAAEIGRRIQGVSGPDRAVLYIVGAYTGFRRNEIGSITPQSFNLDSDPPTLTVAAGHSKHRRTDVLPLRTDFANRIRTWMAQKTKTRSKSPLIDVRDKRTAEMIRKDLKAARKAWIEEAANDHERKAREESSVLTYVDANGHYADFHALRKTFITNLSRANVHPKMAQTLARHSDINLTMNVYTMLGVLDQAAAVEALPPIPTTASQASGPQLRATGT
jgi:integrase